MAGQSPLLDDYNQTGVVTPALQQALDSVRRKLPQFGLQAPSTGTATPQIQPPGAPVPSITRATAAPAAPAMPATPTPGIANPEAGAHVNEANRLISSGSGISQIHQPIVRGLLQGLDAIGEGLFPRLTAAIPGTESHHQGLIKEAQGIVGKDVANAKENATTAETQARTAGMPSAEEAESARAAEAREKNAQAQNLEHPRPKDLTDLYLQQNPNASAAGLADFLQKDYETRETARATADAAARQPSEYADFRNGYLKQNPNATPDEIASKYAAATRRTTPSQYEDFKTDYLKKNPNAGAAEVERAYTQAHEKPEDHGQNFIVNGKLVRVQPGGNVGEGAMTPTQAGSQNIPTSTTRTMIETVPKVLDLTDRIGKLIDEQSASLGPAASRWNEFMAGKVGAPNPEFTKLRTDVGLLQTALMRMHVGARGGGEMMNHFRDLIDVSKQSPENLKAALEEIRDYANAVKAEGGKQTGGEQSVITATNPQTKEKVESTDGGKTWHKPQ